MQVRPGNGREHGLWTLPRDARQLLAVEHRPNFGDLRWGHLLPVLQRRSTQAATGGAMQRYMQRLPAFSKRSPRASSLAATSVAAAFLAGT